jgi:hypothetical protein
MKGPRSMGLRVGALVSFTTITSLSKVSERGLACRGRVSILTMYLTVCLCNYYVPWFWLKVSLPVL